MAVDAISMNQMDKLDVHVQMNTMEQDVKKVQFWYVV